MEPTRRRALATGATLAVAQGFAPALSSALLPALWPGNAAAQGAYPNKPIRFILPFPAGSGTDVGARVIAKQVTEMTGQPVIVDNRAGGNGLIAAQGAATAAPDGYTVFVTTMTTQSVNQALYRKLPYDPEKDFAAVTLFATSPMLLVVRNTPDQPKSVAELVERARKSATPLNYASGNTSSQVAGAVLMKQAGANATHVPYKGTPQGLTDLVAGQVDFFFPDLTPVVPLVREGKLRALGITGNKRVAALPDVPTMGETGFPIELVAWSGAFVPAGTPKPVIERLAELFRKAQASDDYLELARRSGTKPENMTPDEFAAFVKLEVERWGSAVRSAGIEPQ